MNNENVKSQSITTIQDFLDTNNIKKEEDFVSFLIELGLNKKIPELFGIQDGTNFLDMLGNDLSAQISVIDRGDSKKLYVPTTLNSSISKTIEINNHGGMKIIESNHSPVMVNGIRYGNVNIAEMEINELGDLDIIEYNHIVEPSLGLQVVGSKPMFRVTTNRRPMKITAYGKTIKEPGYVSQGIFDTLENGILKPVQNIEQLILNLERLRNMGFDEKYFTKPNIAGFNYDVDGNKMFYEGEHIEEVIEHIFH